MDQLFTVTESDVAVSTWSTATNRSVHQRQDVSVRLHVSHGVVDRVVVVRGLAEPLPRLGVGPVTLHSGPEVADPAPRVTERVDQPSAVEHPRDPHEVPRGVVGDEHGPVTQFTLVAQGAQPGCERARHLRVGGDPLAGQGRGGVLRVGCALVQTPVERVAAGEVDGAELGHDAVHRADPPRFTVDEDEALVLTQFAASLSCVASRELIAASAVSMMFSQSASSWVSWSPLSVPSHCRNRAWKFAASRILASARWVSSSRAASAAGAYPLAGVSVSSATIS